MPIVSFNSEVAVVRVGSDEKNVEAGQHLVVKPVVEENGMCRLTASRLDADGKPVPCHDRYVSGNPEGRAMLFLLPDKSVGLRVSSLALHGPVD